MCHRQKLTAFNYVLSWSRTKHIFKILEGKKACFGKVKVKNEVNRK